MEERIIRSLRCVVANLNLQPTIRKWIKEGDKHIELYGDDISVILDAYKEDCPLLRTIYEIACLTYGDCHPEFDYVWIDDWEECRKFLSKLLGDKE